MQILALSSFTFVLILSIMAGVSIIWALIAGYVIFFLYAARNGKSVKEILRLSLRGIYEARNILIAFALIGMLTASWRASGTIASIICYALPLIKPSSFLAMVFIVNSLISFLTGTSFGTAATMGVICMTMANAMGVNPMLSGGAILSGIFFGDRCSPVSTSALLVADLTKTKVMDNIPEMMRTSLLPFALSLCLYFLLSLPLSRLEPSGADITEIFYANFHIGLLPLLPAFLMLLLSLMHLSTKATMSISIISALVICLYSEDMKASAIPSLLLYGFVSQGDTALSIINGGGMRSMANVALIVAISSSYSPILQETGLLDNIQHAIGKAKIRPSLSITLVSTITCMIACNQTLATMLTHQLCSTLIKDKKNMAIALENTVIVIAALIPWSIAGSVPLTVIKAPNISILASFYLYLLPLCFVLKKRS